MLEVQGRKSYRPRRRPADPYPVPEGLAILQDFLNTVCPRARFDELTTPAELERWLAERNLLAADTRLGHDDLHLALTAREDLRALVRVNNGVEVDRDAVTRLAETVRETRFRLRLGVDGSPCFEPASQGIEGAIGMLIEVMLRGHVAGQWSRFKICADETCRRAYFDRSRGGTGKWCSQQCGSRARGATYRTTDRYKNMPKPRLRFYNS